MLTIPRFSVLLETEDGTAEEVVAIRHADQLRAELEGPKHGLKDIAAAPMHFTGMWVWAAMLREKRITESYQVFKNRILVLEEYEDPDDTVDPTQPGAVTD